MSGGLIQLVGKGAQDELVIGNPSFTFFRSMYKRHSDFAMEHFELYFRSKNQTIPRSGFLNLKAKVERFGQLLNDCYLSITLPDIYSPIAPVTQQHPNLNPNATGIGYEFQWIKNIGYNMINYVSVVINGQEIVRHTGEWMKLYAQLTFDKTKLEKINRLVGNTKDVYDPANSFDRINQYPHAISTSTSLAAPSIPGRTLTIPLHFWFCESVGKALPLAALQYGEVEIVVELKNMYQLFTTLDVRESSPTFGKRIAPDTSSLVFNMSHFLSPPTFADPTIPTNPDLELWNANPYLECNYIFVSDVEYAHIAKTEHAFIVPQVDLKETGGQYGPGSDIEILMRNLCTRIVWVAQRNDVSQNNDYDNYTNWVDANKPPLDSTGMAFMTPWYSSGVVQQPGLVPRDILVETAILLDGKERDGIKPVQFYGNVQNYRHEEGVSMVDMPGIYTYSFALDHTKSQPSGHINGSQFNKTLLRTTYLQPPYTPVTSSNQICVLKSTAGSANPTVVDPNAVDERGFLLYKPGDVITLVTKTTANDNVFDYTYNVRVYVESYNFIRVIGGLANVVFSS
jgi:hypothetical protein